MGKHGRRVEQLDILADTATAAPLARPASVGDEAEVVNALMVSKIRICKIGRPPEGAGNLGLKKQPSRTLSLIGRVLPSVCGASALQNALIANTAYARV
jgi:hypothetical protein